MLGWIEFEVVWSNIRWGLLVSALILSGCTEAPETAAEIAPANELQMAPAPVKNLLLICIDTVRADVFYGMGEAHKDAMSSWEERALVFEQASSTSSWTLPTLGSVFSGLWPPGHGLGQFPGVVAAFGAEIPSTLYKEVPLLAQVAERAGFQSTSISASAWTNTVFYSGGLVKGFKDVLKIEDGWQHILTSLIKVLAQQPEETPAINFLHLMEAHNWHLETEEQLEERIAEFSTEQHAIYVEIAPEQACENEGSLLCKRYLVYASAVQSLREAIATTLETLQERSLLDNTAVIVFSDHGEEFGDHAEDKRLLRDFPNNPDLFVGHGHSMYQELLHVPLMAWHPQYAGATIQSPVSLVDIGPTAARWLGLEFKPTKWPGQFLDAQLSEQSVGVQRVVYSSGISLGEQQISVRQGNKKSISYLASDNSDYYNLGNDPYELRPNATDQFVMRFDGHLLDYIESWPKKTPEKGELSDEQIRRLQSIGYLQGLEVEHKPSSQ